MTTDPSHPEPLPPREERRRRTEAAILHAAQEQFADQGFERTTIRSVAGQAGVDPALVMQYFRNKEGLFAAAARWTLDHSGLAAVPLADLPRAALSEMLDGFEDPARRESCLALLRNCLTHPAAGDVMRDDVMCDTQATIARTIGGDDADLRAGVLGALMLGLMISRDLLEVPALSGATRADLERVVLPALRAITAPPD